MFLFSFVLSPILFIIDFFQAKKSFSKSYLRYGIGILCGIFYCTLLSLVYSPNTYTAANLLLIFLRNWIVFILPLLFLFTFSLLLSIKPLFEKMQASIDSFVGFYTILIPFYVLRYFQSYTIFSFIILPLLFVLSLFALSYSLFCLIHLIKTSAGLLSFIIVVVFILFSMIAASLIYSFWILGFSTFILMLSIIVFIAFIIGLYFWKKNL